MYGFAACLLASTLLVGSSPQAEVVGAPKGTQFIPLAVSTAPVPPTQEALTSDPVPFGHRNAFPSQYLGETRDVFIRLLRGYADEEGPDAARYPVLYVLDGGITPSPSRAWSST
ncbi:MAG: hypothetical protein JSV86_06295 [Gemmatimonadota bacterium]|nr:MAG: hypothetical protein JSV86_06295 [Gemmatimonadota bacterium]